MEVRLSRNDETNNSVDVSGFNGVEPILVRKGQLIRVQGPDLGSQFLFKEGDRTLPIRPGPELRSSWSTILNAFQEMIDRGFGSTCPQGDCAPFTIEAGVARDPDSNQLFFEAKSVARGHAANDKPTGGGDSQRTTTGPMAVWHRAAQRAHEEAAHLLALADEVDAPNPVLAENLRRSLRAGAKDLVAWTFVPCESDRIF